MLYIISQKKKKIKKKGKKKISYHSLVHAQFSGGNMSCEINASDVSQGRTLACTKLHWPVTCPLDCEGHQS